MLRTQRLLTLLQSLRQKRHPVTAHALADELGVSPRTIYRDIDTLRQQGADIRGEAGLGFILQHDFLLPPLTFSEYEIEALVLGMRWVARRAESELAASAKSVLGKINAVLPPALAASLQNQALYPVGSHDYPDSESANLALIRQALREEKRVLLVYCDVNGTPSQRAVWPLAIGYFDSCRLLVAWCELRDDFRHFRTDRIQGAQSGAPFPVPRRILLERWQQQEGIDLSLFDF
ncbi:MAG: YafY family protein [Cardiobacteriaceae bacterium]|nr:YafY family protein [Cardiobacteriaceae bacterium]